ncbi:MAG: hypothetical protein Tsb0018_11390 [Opitutales bacterium]
MDWNSALTVVFVMGGIFFASGIIVLFWCAKNGHLANFEAQAKEIFDEEEPEGVQIDFFPGENNS